MPATPFTIKSAPLTAVSATDPDYETIRSAWKELGEFATGMADHATKLPVEPEPEHFREFGKDLELLARKVDWLISNYGRYLNSNTPRVVDLDLFRDQLSAALEGNCLYEIEACAERVIEDREELAEGDSDAKWAERV